MESKKPHVVCISFSAHCHIKAMLKLVHFRGFHISFVNIDFIHERMIESSYADSLFGGSSFRFEIISDGFPISYERDVPHLCESIKSRFPSPLQNVIMKLYSESTIMDAPPPWSCIVSYGFMSFFTAIVEGFGIPMALFFTVSTNALMGIKQLQAIEERGMWPQKLRMSE